MIESCFTFAHFNNAWYQNNLDEVTKYLFDVRIFPLKILRKLVERITSLHKSVTNTHYKYIKNGIKTVNTTGVDTVGVSSQQKWKASRHRLGIMSSRVSPPPQGTSRITVLGAFHAVHLCLTNVLFYIFYADIFIFSHFFIFFKRNNH